MKKALIGLFLGSLLLLAPGSAGAATQFYVDPDASGTRNGSASNPWQSLADSGAWTAINNTLAGDDVVVYFSARQAGSDTDQTTGTAITIKRTDRSSHRLTLNGMSKWNTNDSAPSWADYSGDSRFHVSGTAYAIAQQRYTTQDYVTVRGFKVTAPNTSGAGFAMEIFRGSHWVVEHCEVDGGEISFHVEYCWWGSQYGGPDTDIVIRNNVFHDAYREVVYIGGNHNEVASPHHDQITIENNVVYNTNCGGGEGDGVDIKDGITNLVVRGNHVYDCSPSGIASHSAGIFEDNIVHDCAASGITYNDFWGLAAHTGCRIRNNLIYNCATSSQYGLAVRRSGSLGITDVVIANNTVHGCGVEAIYIGNANGIDGLVIKNNISFNNINYAFKLEGGQPTGRVEHDHNCYYKSSGNVYGWNGTTKTATTLTEAEPHSVGRNPAVVDEANHDYRLTSSSPCVDTGTTITGFLDDITGLSRPRGIAWDIGAYEYATAGLPVPPPPPTGLEVYPE